MGTSTGYGMPTGGDWTPLKNEATKFVKDAGQGKISPNKLVQDYLKANGGARAIASGGRATANGQKSVSSGGGAARSVGRNLGGFLSSVGASGLGQALREAGLSDLIGKSAEQVSAGLLDALAGPSSTLDEHAARLALAALNDEMFKDTETYEDVEQIFSTIINEQGVIWILGSFFCHYLYERFCRDFYETWIKKVNPSQAAQSLKSIKDYIENSIKTKLTGRDVARINWKGRDGLKLTQQVMQETLEIFEVTT